MPLYHTKLAHRCDSEDKGRKLASVDSLLPDDPIIIVAKVLPKGAVQLPPEVREKLGLKPGTKLIVATAEDAVIMRKAEVLLKRQPVHGIVKRLKSMFSQLPIRDIED